MDPLTLAFQAAGLGMQIFGAAKASAIAGQQAAVSAQIGQYEIQADQQRRQQMELDASRKNMEVLRNAQRARAQGLQAATNQGAQFGSGLQGGYGQIEGAAGNNLLGISQNLKIGENLFDINQNIDQSKIQLAQLGGQMASAQAWSSIGSGIGKVGPAAGNLFSSFGGNGTGSGGKGG